MSKASLVQHLDPRMRILAALAFALVVVPGRNMVMLSAALGLAVALLALARLPWGITLKRMLAMDLFIVAMLMMLPFTLPGETLFTIGPLAASREGLWRALEIALKANAVMLVLLTLAGTLEAVTLGHALGHLRVPEKLVQLLLFTVRYIELLEREYRRLRQAMQARAFVPCSQWHTWRSIGYLFGVLLVRSLERSERIVAAMRCRGFDGRYHRLDELRLSGLDMVFAAGATGCLVGLLWLELG